MISCSRNARSRKTLAWVNGMSSRATGWAGEKVARVETSLARLQVRRWKSGGRSMRAMETTPPVLLNAGEEIALVARTALVWTMPA